MTDDTRKGKRIPIEDEEAVTVEAATAEAAGAGVAEEVAAEGGLVQKVADLEAALAESKEATLRAIADLHNYRRRTNEERVQQMQFANEGLVAELLPIIDNFGLAINCNVTGDEAQNVLRGVCMIQQQLLDLLARFGVEPIKTEDEFFDPAKHEAVERVETNDVCEGTIVGEVLAGYVLNGRVVRPAKVKVAVQPH